MVEFFKRDPVFRALIIDLVGHACPVAGQVLVSQGYKESRQLPPFIGRKRRKLGFDFLNAHRAHLTQMSGFGNLMSGFKRRFDRMEIDWPLLFFLLALNFLGDGLRDALDPKSAKD